jgi:hypothetical protein
VACSIRTKSISRWKVRPWRVFRFELIPPVQKQL